jgi:ATP-dependent Clp protease ATP-binding subunit ClpX
VDCLARILTQPNDTLVAQFRKLVRTHEADLVFTDATIDEVARIALERRSGARGLRSVIEEVTESVMFEIEAGVTYAITEKTVRGGEAIRQSLSQSKAPLTACLMRRSASGQTGSFRRSDDR